MRTSIVFVHIGPQLPGHLKVALGQARFFNQKSRIILIVSAEAIIRTPLSRNLNIEIVPCEALGLSLRHQDFLEFSNLDKKFREGFWLHTTERFFYLETLMVKHKITDVVHLENDNMLYVDLETILPTLQAHYPGIAATFDAPDRCVPGFIYIKNAPALSSFTEFATAVARQNNTRYNDMALLALFKEKFDFPSIASLPIIPTRYPLPLQNRVGCVPQECQDYNNHFNQFNSIFDAAAIGQYLGGIDPANSADAKDTSGFINETSVFDPSVYTYHWTLDANQRRVPTAKDGTNTFRINNLHIHSKKLDKFSSWKRNFVTDL